MRLVILFVLAAGLAAPRVKKRSNKKRLTSTRTPGWVQAKTVPPKPRPPKPEVEEEDKPVNDPKLALIMTPEGPVFTITDDAPRDPAEVRQELVELYTKYNPAKIPDIDWLMEKYKGQEQLLVSGVLAKYSGAGVEIKASDELLELNEQTRRRSEAEQKQRLDDRLKEIGEASVDELIPWQSECAEEKELVEARLAATVRADVMMGETQRAADVASRAPSTLDDFEAALLERPCFDVRGDLAAFATAVSLTTDLSKLDILKDLEDKPTYTRWGPLLRAVYARKLPLELVFDVYAQASRLGPVDTDHELAEVMNFACVASVSRLGDADAMARMPKFDMPEVVVLGRSNVGKSSLVNKLLNRKTLAPTSALPGRTRRFVFYGVNVGVDHCAPPFVLVDIPGAGFATDDQGFAEIEGATSSKIDSWRSLTSRYLNVRDALKAALHLVDARRAADGTLPQTDLELLDTVSQANLARDAPFAHVIVLTKIDKISRPKLKKAIDTVHRELKLRKLTPILADVDRTAQSHVPVVATSATARPPKGRELLWRTILRANGLDFDSSPIHVGDDGLLPDMADDDVLEFS